MIEWCFPMIAWASVMGALCRGLQVLAGERGPRYLPLVVGMIAWIPIKGLPLARWIHGYNSNISLPLVVILLNAVLSPLTRRPWFDQRALRASVWFGAITGLLLYPMAAGLGSFDPYALGWQRPGIEIPVTGLSLVLLWRRNTFGWVLLLSGAAWRVGCLESVNVWDYLIDPVYFVISLIGLAMPCPRESTCTCAIAVSNFINRNTSIEACPACLAAEQNPMSC